MCVTEERRIAREEEEVAEEEEESDMEVRPVGFGMEEAEHLAAGAQLKAEQAVAAAFAMLVAEHQAIFDSLQSER